MTLDLDNLVKTTIASYKYESVLSLSAFDDEPAIIEKLIFARTEHDIKQHLLILLAYCHAKNELPSEVFHSYWENIYSRLDPTSQPDEEFLKNHLDSCNFRLIRAMNNSGDFERFDSFIDVLILAEDLDKLILLHHCTFEVLTVEFNHPVYEKRPVPEFLVKCLTNLQLSYYPEYLLKSLSSSSVWLRSHIKHVIDECLREPDKFMEILATSPEFGKKVRQNVRQHICGDKSFTECLKTVTGTKQEFLINSFIR